MNIYILKALGTVEAFTSFQGAFDRVFALGISTDNATAYIGGDEFKNTPLSRGQALLYSSVIDQQGHITFYEGQIGPEVAEISRIPLGE